MSRLACHVLPGQMEGCPRDQDPPRLCTVTRTTAECLERIGITITRDKAHHDDINLPAAAAVAATSGGSRGRLARHGRNCGSSGGPWMSLTWACSHVRSEARPNPAEGARGTLTYRKLFITITGHWHLSGKLGIASSAKSPTGSALDSSKTDSLSDPPSLDTQVFAQPDGHSSIGSTCLELANDHRRTYLIQHGQV